MIGLLVWLVFIAVAFAIAWWIVNLLPLPPPFQIIIQVVFALIALVIVFYLLLGLAGPVPGVLR